MPLIGLLLLFIVVPLAELYVIIQVAPKLLGGGTQGAVLTIALLAADSIVGAALLRSQGRAVWTRFTEAMAAGRGPHREVIDGVLVIFGGAFLITPGFITDFVGLLLLLPPTRAMFRRMIVRGAGSRFFVVRMAGGGAHDVEGTAVETDQPRLDP
jgi:UPF0716 protein FxsA